MEQSKSADTTGNNSNYAGFWRRLSANIIDGLILTIIIVGFGSEVGLKLLPTNTKESSDGLVKIIQLIISFVYSVLFWVNYDGSTPGKRFLGIKIVKEDGQKIDYPMAIVRYVGYWISSIPLFLGFFWLIWDKKKQTWHDKLAKTVVVKTDKSINKFVVAAMTILSFIVTIGIITGPTIYGEMKKEIYKRQRDQKYVQDIKKYSESVKNLDEESSKLIKSALAKVQEANKKAGNVPLSETEKQEVQNLLASAISEAKQASALKPENAVTWIQLGNVYSALIGVAQNADTWAIDSYTKAIEKDPNNYLYHEKLGGVYLRVEKYEQAIGEFRKVVELSPSYSNGYYNLGFAYKKYGAKSRAKEAFNKALELLPTDDPDRFKAEKELETL